MDNIALIANVIRGLAMDTVEAAKSGHPGLPMGAADYAATLFFKHLKHSPTNPSWPDRDRFVLSAGHGSALVYALLHLAGYEVTLDQLKAFRQWESGTPGHPEYGDTPGVETTTGPLGQGCANAVGMALAERLLADTFNTDDFTLVDHLTYVICSDGDLMEGISHEAFSLAGHLGLHKLIAIYDDNKITIEGATDLAYSDDVRKRFESYHWNVLEIDGHDLEQIHQALETAKNEAQRPTLIVARTHIAHGAPNLHDSSKAHGAPLGDDEIKAAKQNLGLPADQAFYVPDEVRAQGKARAEEMAGIEKQWNTLLDEYRKKHPEKAALWDNYHSDTLPDDLSDCLPTFDKAVATRAASGSVLQELAKVVPNLVGGSADLAPSNNTMLKEYGSVGPDSFTGRNLHFGIREHAMGGMLNGMALHGGLRVYGATFFVFLDYCRPSVRLAAIMGLPVVYVFTHDSFFVGEDGPTHQPVEQLASLRCMPNMTVIRPADATETAAAWIAAMKNLSGPSVLVLTRQKLPLIDRNLHPPASEVEKGAYVLWQSADGNPDLVLLASGSEVSLAFDAGRELAKDHVVRVVSMPSWELFEKQDEAYRAQVVPRDCKARLAIEAGSGLGWKKYVGDNGIVLCMDHFGASAPYTVLEEKFGFTVKNILNQARALLKT